MMNTKDNKEGDKMAETYKLYNKDEAKATDLFQLIDDEIPVYNGLIEKLNKGIDDLLAYKKELRETKGMNEYQITDYLAKDPKYQDMYKEHSETYDKYLTMQEEAIIRTNGGHETTDSLDENDSR